MDNNLNQQQPTQPQPLPPTQAVPVQQTVPTPQAPIQEPPKGSNKLLIILLVIIVITMILAGVYWFMVINTRKAQKQASTQFTQTLTDMNNELKTLEEEPIESELTDVDNDLNQL